MGLSTYGNILCFLQLNYNEYPCLILDQRLIDTFSSNLFSEFNTLSEINYDNAEKRYFKYLQLMNQVSIDLKTKEENIEEFLFIFGKNLS